ncbi:RNA ligase [Tenacibaculum amylolyticum]|uniref:RNA ligase n=1 Tax=Tenacibaculum amylolyticum TaxID=104269 RepID=UPI00389533BF
MKNRESIDITEFQKYVKEGYFTLEKHPNADLQIYGYSTGPLASKNLRWNPVTRQMRGLITNSKGEIKARSFEKFFTFIKYTSPSTVQLSDGQLAKLPNLPYKVYEKLDGSLAVLYWIDDTPYLATQRSFTSLKAQKATEILHQKYSHTFDKLKKDRTYIFEAIYPESKVLIDYGQEEKLILLGVLDNKTGKDHPLEDIGFPIAKEWTQEVSNLKSFDELVSLNSENKEGLVIVYENGFRVKIKFPWYKEAHLMINKIIQYEYHIDLINKKLKNLLNLPENKPNSIKIWERFNNNETVSDILKDFPNQYQFLGIENILNKEFTKFKKTKNSVKTPSPDDSSLNIDLDINKNILHPSSENIMWNRWKNLENKYD